MPATAAEWDVEDLYDRVSEDTDITPQERETTIRFAKDEDTARVFTAEAGLMRRLLLLDHVEVEHVVERGDGEEQTVNGLVAQVPIAALSVKSVPRETDQHAALVSKRSGR